MHAPSNCIGVTLVISMKIVTEQKMLTEINAETLTKKYSLMYG
jgi:hypothetical protein